MTGADGSADILGMPWIVALPSSEATVLPLAGAAVARLFFGGFPPLSAPHHCITRTPTDPTRFSTAGTGLPESDIAALKGEGSVPGAKFGRANNNQQQQAAA